MSYPPAPSATAWRPPLPASPAADGGPLSLQDIASESGVATAAAPRLPFICALRRSTTGRFDSSAETSRIAAGASMAASVSRWSAGRAADSISSGGGGGREALGCSTFTVAASVAHHSAALSRSGAQLGVYSLSRMTQEDEADWRRVSVKAIRLRLLGDGKLSPYPLN